MDYRESIGAGPPTEENLRFYLDSLQPQEWNKAEYKSYTDTVGVNLSREVAAMANGGGGEIFIGVRDDRAIEGSNVTEVDIRNALRQPDAPRDALFTSDISEVINDLIIVPLERREGSLRAYVLKVVPNGKLVIAKDKYNNYEIFRRRGDSTERAFGWEVIRMIIDTNRERMLKSIYSELKTLHQRMSHGQYWQYLGLGLDFPYLQSVLEDGSIYRYLSERDIEVVLGKSSDGRGWEGGYYTELVEIRARMQFQFNQRVLGWNDDVREMISGARERTGKQVEYFRQYLVDNGIDVN